MTKERGECWLRSARSLCRWRLREPSQRAARPTEIHDLGPVSKDTCLDHAMFWDQVGLFLDEEPEGPPPSLDALFMDGPQGEPPRVHTRVPEELRELDFALTPPVR